MLKKVELPFIVKRAVSMFTLTDRRSLSLLVPDERQRCLQDLLLHGFNSSLGHPLLLVVLDQVPAVVVVGKVVAALGNL